MQEARLPNWRYVSQHVKSILDKFDGTSLGDDAATYNGTRLDVLSLLSHQAQLTKVQCL